MLSDCPDISACMGPYGVGLATAILSEPIQLPLLTEPLVIDRVKFGLGGTFPFSLWEMQPVSHACLAVVLPVADTQGWLHVDPSPHSK